jgi:hypothetical protein
MCSGCVLYDVLLGTEQQHGMLCILAGHASGMVAVDVSADGRALLGVGLDAQSRQLAVLWDISSLRSGGKVGMKCASGFASYMLLTLSSPATIQTHGVL